MKWIVCMTVQQLFRKRWFYIVIFMALALMLFSLPMGLLSLDEQARVLFDLGSIAIELASLGLALVLGNTWLPRQAENQTGLLIMARPLNRWEYYLGTWLGIALTELVMVGMLTLVLWIFFQRPNGLLFLGAMGLGCWMESLVILALGFFASQFLRPVLAVFLCLSVFLMGHWLPELHFFATQTGFKNLIAFDQIATWIVPQLYRTNWRSLYIFESGGISPTDFIITFLHTSGWTILFLFLGIQIFRRKDFV